MARRKLQRPLRPLKNRRQHLQRALGYLLRAGRYLLHARLSCRMNHILELAVRKGKTPNIARQQRDRWIGRQVRTIFRKGRRVPCEDRCMRAKLLHAIDVGKALDQPAAKKACTSSDEYLLVAHLMPEIPRFG